MIKRFLQYIFKITRDYEGRKIVILFGKTFIINQNGYELKQIKAFLELSTDITKLPKATGIPRLIQKANVILLKHITDLCEENDLVYWINYGTLLGAVRHGGFIPWDDDLDICMPRDDWEKLIKILDEKFKDTQYYYNVSDCLRVYYRNTPLQLDIFPLDYYYKHIETQEEVDHLFDKINKAKTHLKYYVEKDNIFDIKLNKSYEELRKLHNDIVMENKPAIKPASLIRAFETRVWHLSYYPYDWIFPLQKIEFEGEMFYAPNKISTVLYENYGDYMQFPKTLTHQHKNIQEKITPNTIAFLEDYIKEAK